MTPELAATVTLTPYTRPQAYLEAVAAAIRKMPPEHLAVELDGIARVLATLAADIRRHETEPSENAAQ